MAHETDVPAAAPAGVVDREAARVLLLDGARRLLLFRGCDPAAPAGRAVVVHPRRRGRGRRDPGADGPARAVGGDRPARRPVEGPVAERTTEFGFDGVAYRQHEHYFVARLETRTWSPARPRTPSWRPGRCPRLRWWTDADLAATDDVVHPGWLAAWLTAEVGGRTG